KGVSLVKATLQTGRTHQIRVHFEYINHPLLGDPVYGGKRTETPWIKRQCLHAKEISFIHPTTHKILSFESPLPSDIEYVLTKLQNIK
ncbi:MAG TPA: RNA pseudouridine synthase, partial [Vampirovibrionales bacterium]